MLSSPKALYTTPKVICRKVLLEQLVFPTIPMCPLEADQQAKAPPGKHVQDAPYNTSYDFTVPQSPSSVNRIQKTNSAAVHTGPLRCCLIQKSSLTRQCSSFRSSMAFFRAACSRFFCAAVLGFWISDVGGP